MNTEKDWEAAKTEYLRLEAQPEKWGLNDYEPITRKGLRAYFTQSHYNAETDRIDWSLEEIITLFRNTDFGSFIGGFLAGVQHARQGERERLKRFIAKYDSAIATGRLSGGEFALSDDMVIDEFLEQEAK